MKSIEKHVFDQSAEALSYASLGDVCVRIIALKNIVDQNHLDYKVIPIKKAAFYPLWELAFNNHLAYSLNDVNLAGYQTGIMHSPTRLDWQLGSAGFNVFESIYWENGFFRTSNLRIRVMNLIPSNYGSKAIMIYPNEKTDGNVVYDSKFWIETCIRLKKANFKIHLIGDSDHEPLQDFYSNCEVDYIYQPTVENLVHCIRNSSFSLGSSTGPTWACLMSDIRQIVLESKRSPHGYWFFDRCRDVLEKNIKIVPTLDSLLV